jgi:hypothetical protein
VPPTRQSQVGETPARRVLFLRGVSAAVEEAALLDPARQRATAQAQLTAAWGPETLAARAEGLGITAAAAGKERGTQFMPIATCRRRPVVAGALPAWTAQGPAAPASAPRAGGG